jgi:hypothetical protein
VITPRLFEDLCLRVLESTYNRDDFVMPFPGYYLFLRVRYILLPKTSEVGKFNFFRCELIGL